MRDIIGGHRVHVTSTVPGIGPGKWDKGALAREQEQHAAHTHTMDTLVARIYTEANDDIPEQLAFCGVGAYSLYRVDGAYNGIPERGAVIEIIGAHRDIVFRVAHFIAAENGQTEVLVTFGHTDVVSVTV